jgi:hypothetical protein
MTDANETVDLEAIHRAAAPHAFNETWQYLDRDHLTPAEEEAMLSAAFAQRYHWYAVGDPRNRAIADWQVSELADRFARRSLETCLEHGLDPFVTGFAHEAIARAAAEVDDVDTFTENLEAARALLGKIEDEEERKILAADLAEMSE